MTKKLFDFTKDTNYTPDSLNSSLEELNDNLPNDIEISNEIYTALEYFDIMFSVAERIEKRKQVTIEDIAIIKTSAHMAALGKNISTEALIPNIDTTTPYTIAIEGILSKIGTGIRKIFEFFINMGESVAKSISYGYNVLVSSEKRLNNLTDTLKHMRTDKRVTISIPYSSKLTYGWDYTPVKNFQEYLTQYDRASRTVGSFNFMMGKYINDEFLSSIVAFLKAITLQNTEYAYQKVAEFDKFIKELEKNDKFKKDIPMFQSLHYVEELTNIPFLGGYYFEITRPDLERAHTEDNRKDPTSYSIRLRKEFLKSKDDHNDEIIFGNVSKSDVIKLAAYAKRYSDSCKEHDSIINILSQLGGLITHSSSIIEIFTSPISVAIKFALFKAYRAYITSNRFIMTATGTSMSYSISQQKQAERIIERYISLAS